MSYHELLCDKCSERIGFTFAEIPHGSVANEAGNYEKDILCEDCYEGEHS